MWLHGCTSCKLSTRLTLRSSGQLSVCRLRSFAFQVGSSIDDLASNAFGTASSCLPNCLQLRSAPCQLVVQVVSFLGRSATLLVTVALVGLACYGLRLLINAVVWRTVHPARGCLVRSQLPSNLPGSYCRCRANVPLLLKKSYRCADTNDLQRQNKFR
jgi:hypothetical protein